MSRIMCSQPKNNQKFRYPVSTISKSIFQSEFHLISYLQRIPARISPGPCPELSSSPNMVQKHIPATIQIEYDTRPYLKVSSNQNMAQDTSFTTIFKLEIHPGPFEHSSNRNIVQDHIPTGILSKKATYYPHRHPKVRITKIRLQKFPVPFYIRIEKKVKSCIKHWLGCLVQPSL